LFVCKCVLYYCHRVVTQLQFNKYILYQFIDCMLYYVNTIPHTPAPFFGLFRHQQRLYTSITNTVVWWKKTLQ